MRGLAVLAALALTWAAIQAVAAESSQSASVRLEAGTNAVTWSGSEPYAIANFEGTPISKIHRFDAVRQRWLSRAVGQDDATLPELHLLPRVQYLMISDEAHELTIPNPITDVDPLARLRFPAAPDDPLRFEAYWPNEDSPLEDLVVLRGEERRLSVKAWIAGGEGDVSVWWAIDGRVNHAGLESGDVDLTPGAHDHGRLYAVDDAGQSTVVELPRVVRLPELDLPEMTYGVNAFTYSPLSPYTPGPTAIDATFDLVQDAGFTTIYVWLFWSLIESGWPPALLSDLDRIVEVATERGITLMTTLVHTPFWAATKDVSVPTEERWADTINSPATDPADFASFAQFAARRWPEIRYWEIRDEPNIIDQWFSRDPYRLADEVRAVALAIQHVNPDAVIIAPAPAHQLLQAPTDAAIPAPDFLNAMYEAGVMDWVDIASFTLFRCPREFAEPLGRLDEFYSLQQIEQSIDYLQEIKTRHGDAGKPIWAYSLGAHNARTWGGVTEKGQASCLTNMLALFRDREDVQGAIVWQLQDNGDDPESKNNNLGLVEFQLANGEFVPKPSYWAVREFLTGQPPP